METYENHYDLLTTIEKTVRDMIENPPTANELQSGALAHKGEMVRELLNYYIMGHELRGTHFLTSYKDKEAEYGIN